MVKVELTKGQFQALQSILNLIQKREREPPQKKKTEINYHSIHKQSGMSQNGVKYSLRRLHEQICISA